MSRVDDLVVSEQARELERLRAEVDALRVERDEARAEVARLRAMLAGRHTIEPGGVE